MRALKDPVRRAEYVLSSNGFDIAFQGTKDVPPELLEEVFELNMALEESDAAQIGQLRERFSAMRHSIDEGLAGLFAKYDAGGGHAALTEIRGVLNRRRYIDNLVQKIEAGG